MSVSPAFVPTILEFWFGSSDPGAQVAGNMKLWFGASEETDALIKQRFHPLHAAACRGDADKMKDTAGGRLAFVILIDQFSRNLYRNSHRAFAQDRRALTATLEGLEAGVDKSFGMHQRAFFYLPLEHAEDRHLQQRSVELFSRLVEDAPAHMRDVAKHYYDYAVQHRDVIETFGRFPHRNTILGRTTTTEEFAYLRQPDALFGTDSDEGSDG